MTCHIPWEVGLELDEGVFVLSNESMLVKQAKGSGHHDSHAKRHFQSVESDLRTLEFVTVTVTVTSFGKTQKQHSATEPKAVSFI